ncbi:glutamyl-tRNA reductase [Cesiribacter andamanensis]|uniref:Glutamyl-tRNA reductase n=1 Tax=Cesiribacter andamanensis AMV16 TaxID=1279009 RepID=M7P135_9BACT|nr:glutamyl-tRNA reductase [Cesiribacter andamanensis]EMR04289.1 Glutamyl-tRNA reductase [Cesiribacter andamanensis AMV16]
MMQIGFKALSLSFKKAPLEIRELVSLSEENCQALLQHLRDVLGLAEALVISTCNRTEIYYAAEQDLSRELIGLIGVQKGILRTETIQHYFESFTETEAAVRQLFRVALGLESQVVGDLQISHQIKRAYQWTADANMAGPFLHRLLHAIFFTNKKVVQQTSFRDGAASVSYAAAELVEELTANLLNPQVLLVGLGEIGADVCRHLSKQPHLHLTISNRTLAKAEAMAAECGARVIPFEEVQAAICDANVVISSVAMEQPFITRAALEQSPRLGYQIYVDLSVPRSIDAHVEELPGVLLYNVDNINNLASAALERRKEAIPQVELLAEEAIVEFFDWTRDMMVSPTIQKLKNALEQIRQEEITRYLKTCSEQEAQLVDRITKSMMQKIIKLPVLQLKAACKRGEAETLIDVLNDLFNLEASTQPHKD